MLSCNKQNKTIQTLFAECKPLFLHRRVSGINLYIKLYLHGFKCLPTYTLWYHCQQWRLRISVWARGRQSVGSLPARIEPVLVNTKTSQSMEGLRGSETVQRMTFCGRVAYGSRVTRWHSKRVHNSGLPIWLFWSQT